MFEVGIDGGRKMSTSSKYASANRIRGPVFSERMSDMSLQRAEGMF